MVTETSVSMLLILHCAPTITPPLKSVTRPEIRALSVYAKATTENSRRSTTSTGDFIEHSP